ncbi:hypothetical protein ACTXT7_017384 [Hymenolepis weldensis]
MQSKPDKFRRSSNELNNETSSLSNVNGQQCTSSEWNGQLHWQMKMGMAELEFPNKATPEICLRLIRPFLNAHMPEGAKVRLLLSRLGAIELKRDGFKIAKSKLRKHTVPNGP